MPSHSQESEISVNGGVTDGPDPESSRSSFFECCDNSNNGTNDKEDDDGGWDAMEAIFTQHDRSLSQKDANSDAGSGSGEAGALENDSKPSATERISTDNTAETDEFKSDIFDSTEFDEELLAMGARIDAKYTPKKEAADSSNLNPNPNSSVNTQTINKDVKPQPKARGLLRKNSTGSKKRQRSLFQTVKNERRRNKSFGSAQTNTLTQLFSTVQKEESNKEVATETPSIDTQSNQLNGLVEIRLRGQMRKTSFKEGDVWLPYEKPLRDKGFAFTIGSIYIVGMSHEADIAASWMRVENAFLGPEEAVRVKQCTGSDWVLVKKHEMLPSNGRIPLQQLSHRLTNNLPNKATTLCYEMDDKITHSFYYECGNPTRRNPNQNERPCALDLFAGAGGTSIGLEKANINVKYKVELNKTACDTLQMNFPNSYVFCEDIAKFLESCKSQRANVYPKRGDVDYLHGSPPCQGFSAVNTSGGANDEQNNECTIKFLEVAEHHQPTFVSMENVPGMGQDKNIRYLLRIVGGLLNQSYQVRTCLVKASSFGDPQTRARVIILASKKGYKLPILKPTHGGEKLKVVTARDVLHDLEDIDPVPGVGLVQLPNGGHVWDHFKEGTDLAEKSDNNYVLNANLPANTVRKGNQMRHYKHDRYITVRERARLQSFPYGHRFAGGRKDAFNQIGNAVPVGLATAIGMANRKL